MANNGDKKNEQKDNFTDVMRVVLDHKPDQSTPAGHMRLEDGTLVTLSLKPKQDQVKNPFTIVLEAAKGKHK